MITLYQRVGPDHIRYYSINDQQLSLLSDFTFSVSYTVGKSGAWRERQDSFKTAGEMDAAIRKLIRRKLKEGYAVLYTFGKFKRSGQMATTLLDSLQQKAN
jgi:hypothetical protein